MDIPRKGKPFDLLLLKKRYRKAAATYHPDKHPPDSREVMQDKFYAVTRSYEQVLVWHKDTYENTGENAHG
jgi:DnaJ-class molecular chaperone